MFGNRIGSATDKRYDLHVAATCAGQAPDIVRIPSAIIQPAIAASIVYVAADNPLSRFREAVAG